MKRYEKVWLVYVKFGKRWVCLRNSKVFPSKKAALASMAEDCMDRQWYQPLRIDVPIVDLVIP